ncbi:MAG: TlpA family protein disulfide reductase [Cytophagales bacterium]|nr:TlpA family protein disulfide reductase [Armatimonadota bacterium]
MTRRRWLWIAAAGIVAYVAAGNALRVSRSREGVATPFRPPGERKPFRALRGTTLPDGTPWELASLRGRVVLLNYAATWCPPCRRETPDLVVAADRYRAHGFEVIGVMMDEGSQESVLAVTRPYVKEYGISYPLIRPDDDPLLRFAAPALPTSILLDRKGHAVRTYVGPVSPAVLSEDVERLVAE